MANALRSCSRDLAGAKSIPVHVSFWRGCSTSSAMPCVYEVCTPYILYAWLAPTPPPPPSSTLQPPCPLGHRPPPESSVFRRNPATYLVVTYATGGSVGSDGLTSYSYEVVHRYEYLPTYDARGRQAEREPCDAQPGACASQATTREGLLLVLPFFFFSPILRPG